MFWINPTMSREENFHSIIVSIFSTKNKPQHHAVFDNSINATLLICIFMIFTGVLIHKVSTIYTIDSLKLSNIK